MLKAQIWLEWTINTLAQELMRRLLRWHAFKVVKQQITTDLETKKSTKTFLFSALLKIHSDELFRIATTWRKYTSFLSVDWPKEIGTSVTRLGNLLHFGQLFKACGNN